MIILGIDPGTATTGFGVLKTDGKTEKYELIDWGWIKTDKDSLRENRLVTIHEEMLAILKKHKPDVLAIERLFFATNVKTAMAVSESLGVIRLAAAKQKIPVFDYAPMSIKLVVGGSGKADKILMKATVRKLLSIRAPNHKKTYFDDVCDALAVAICHHRRTVTGYTETSNTETQKTTKQKHVTRNHRKKNTETQNEITPKL
ncbi:crossover junction endodeoxyribonuclease RuvC [Candidatus Shapirobacteria bacterium CG08_land_8_20_14_0_20_39_18]|uniref:Crossover junction endodeoxyribonuclease RuvC n=1 Tax=Candidatus Shapirobacteria bacterium CG08_land_8_20_14_0_20_39_18 TaxID=1974883 RepID=A0A2M6XD43_9BACT|nr:MAG: crossover junction endodeoxyribonuclease RuvC [Candidatus Shapirobacteria bacterium CG08_land_8_20_14_0_20_39_18]PIY65288.1 MAG: crossover junction endodeoxyribonuclease RuvC [Candidatus Shapirobacteria bacterium CG_4_10_14_0_8_um_filter_39_15]PJE68114.1 MAG: crossover junction endodeoxyribonuclease RuvC [Candidatus Shapirobacteria bacterium CG10_big_fil_rev_8_21_14_0_10_38_8]